MKRVLSSILQLLLVTFTAAAQNLRPYATYTEENKTLTFYYDDRKEARKGMDLEPYAITTSVTYMPWKISAGPIETVVFDPSMTNCHSITSTAYWFYDIGSLKEIVGIENLNTENVTDMSWMFCACVNLESIDLTKLDTRNVMDMSGMFHFCFKLSSLDLSKLDTGNVTSMNRMFYHCDHLTSLDLSNLDTSNLTNMSEMFLSCTSLTSLDLSSFDTRSVTNMEDMFALCSSLTCLDLSGFDTRNVITMNGMFRNCPSLTTLDVSNFDTQNVKDMTAMFQNCSSLTTIYCNDNWNVWGYLESQFSSMFDSCIRLKGAISYKSGYSSIKYANPDTGYFTRTATPIHLPEKSVGAQPDVYNLSGYKLTAPQKGINIIGGRKVVMK